MNMTNTKADEQTNMEPTFVTRFFYQKPITPGRETCAVCGLPTEPYALTGKVLRPTFTDHEFLRCPTSNHVCPACEYYMNHQELRRANWWLTGDKALPIERDQLRPFITVQLYRPLMENGYLIITTSKRKHIGLRAPLNMAGSKALRVQFETVTLDLTAALWQSLTAACDTLKQHHTWKEILSDSYEAWRLAKWTGLPTYVAAREVVRPHLRTPYLDLVKFVSVENATTKEDDSDPN